MSRATDYGPTLLIPAAWALTLAAHRGLVSRHAVFVALWVMTVLLAAFALASRGAMTGPVLPLWRTVIRGGFVVTFAGGVLSLGGAVAFALGVAGVTGDAAVTAGVAAVGVGQTAGIVAAAAQNAARDA